MNQRLKKAVELLKKQRKVRSDAECAIILGIDKGDLSRFLSGKRPITQRFVGVFTTHFPEISKEWLLNGEGEMLNNHSAVAENHSISIAGEEIKENNIQVNTDQTIASLIAEVTAQRKLTESTLAEVAAQRKLTEIALQQNSDLLAMMAKGKE